MVNLLIFCTNLKDNLLQHRLVTSRDITEHALLLVRSPEVEMGQIFLLNIFNENGKVPSDIPSDTKKSIRVVH